MSRRSGRAIITFVVTVAIIAGCGGRHASRQSSPGTPVTRQPRTSQVGVPVTMPDPPNPTGTPPSWHTVLSVRRTADVVIAPGIRYVQTSYGTSVGPQRVSALYIDLRAPNVRFTPVLHKNFLASAGETVSAMAAATGAIAGSNGDFFDAVGQFPLPLGQGQPTHLLVEDGQLIAGGLPDDCAVLQYTESHAMIFGRESFFGEVTSPLGSLRLSAINTLVDPDQSSQCNTPTEPLGLVLMTSAWSATPTPMDSPAPVAELTKLRDGQYRVQSVAPDMNVFPIQPPGHFALVGEGSSADYVRDLHPGEMLTVSETLRPNSSLQAAVGGGFLLLKDGVVNSEIAGVAFPHEAATVVGTNQDGTQLVLAVFDGQQRHLAIGIGYAEEAGWLQSQGMVNGMQFDGGGSSTLVAVLPGTSQVSVLNSPSDGAERHVAECLCFYSY